MSLFSKIVFADVKSTSGFQLQNNPVTSNYLQVAVSGVLKNSSYSIYNGTGFMIKKGNVENTTGQLAVNITNLARGVYIIRFSNNNEIIRFVRL